MCFYIGNDICSIRKPEDPNNFGIFKKKLVMSRTNTSAFEEKSILWNNGTALKNWIRFSFFFPFLFHFPFRTPQLLSNYLNTTHYSDGHLVGWRSNIWLTGYQMRNPFHQATLCGGTQVGGIIDIYLANNILSWCAWTNQFVLHRETYGSEIKLEHRLHTDKHFFSTLPLLVWCIPWFWWRISTRKYL